MCLRLHRQITQEPKEIISNWHKKDKALKTKLSGTLTVFGAQRVRQLPMRKHCGNKHISYGRRWPFEVLLRFEEIYLSCTVSQSSIVLAEWGQMTRLTSAAPRLEACLCYSWLILIVYEIQIPTLTKSQYEIFAVWLMKKPETEGILGSSGRSREVKFTLSR